MKYAVKVNYQTMLGSGSRTITVEADNEQQAIDLAHKEVKKGGHVLKIVGGEIDPIEELSLPAPIDWAKQRDEAMKMRSAAISYIDSVTGDTPIDFYYNPSAKANMVMRDKDGKTVTATNKRGQKYLYSHTTQDILEIAAAVQKAIAGK